jgi:hypothetical protein
MAHIKKMPQPLTFVTVRPYPQNTAENKAKTTASSVAFSLYKHEILKAIQKMRTLTIMLTNAESP